MDFVLMAQGAGYRNAWVIDDLEDFRLRLPAILAAEGPVLVELHTTLAEQTPMTAPRGAPLHEQVRALRAKLLRPRAAWRGPERPAVKPGASGGDD